nr:hypothetical protein [Kibdelosporangium sp. MJ126-NF4]
MRSATWRGFGNSNVDDLAPHSDPLDRGGHIALTQPDLHNGRQQQRIQSGVWCAQPKPAIMACPHEALGRRYAGGGQFGVRPLAQS